MTCGDCPECLARTWRLMRTSPCDAHRRPPAPTAAELEKHARRFGPGGVAETAAELGVDVKVELPKLKPRRRGPTRKERVAGHIKAGHSVDVIAELEGITTSYARRLIEELS